jgi:hypothetical protein
MGLFGLFGKKASKTHQEDLSRLTKDGKLPWGWYSANRKFTEQIDNEYKSFSDALNDAKKKSVLAEYGALKSLVMYMEDVKQLCASKGECFVEWASIVVANTDTISEYKERLRFLEDNMDALLAKEKMLRKLNADLKKIITEEPGVIQSDLYKRFDASMKAHISNELYQMEAHNVIIREKIGRSYKLYMK